MFIFRLPQVQFAAEVLLSLPDINSRLNLDTKLNMRIGIGSGELCSALVGDVSRSFEVYGGRFILLSAFTVHA